LYALGINQDLYCGGVALSDGKHLLYASNEERFSRIKNDGGFPHQALQGLLSYTKIDPREISDVCISGILTPPLPFRLLPSLQKKMQSAQDARRDTALRRVADFVIHHTPVSRQRPGGPASSILRRLIPTLLRRDLPSALKNARIHIVEHHPAHAWCAYYLSGFERALCLTSDGMGDCVSISVSHCENGQISPLTWRSPEHSLGLFFEVLTEAFGYVPSRDEGKLTGLAAHGDPARVSVPSPFTVVDGQVQYRGPHGLQATQWIANEILSRYSREDVAAWAQNILELTLVEVVRYWAARTGHNRLVFGGGTAANVKLNQRLLALPEIDEIFIAPNMSDGGNPVGALAGAGFLARERVKNVFLGDDFSDAQIDEALQRAGLEYTVMPNPSVEIGTLLANGATVGRFDGRMEWGPRALGNRSILAPATDRAQIDRLNAQLKRTDFMPFAPAMLAEEADRFLHNHHGGRFAGEFMTICYDCSAEMKARFPAVVHVDDTARAQIVCADANPGLHAILSEYARHTGAGVVLNTSFNIHEEPIVRTPAEAIASFQKAGLDYLALGSRLVAASNI